MYHVSLFIFSLLISWFFPVFPNNDDDFLSLSGILVQSTFYFRHTHRYDTRALLHLLTTSAHRSEHKMTQICRTGVSFVGPSKIPKKYTDDDDVERRR